MSSQQGRTIRIGVNDRYAKKFLLAQTGPNCLNGGETTVVPVDLKGFKRGENSISFINNGTDLVPMIEWISVVNKV